MDAKKQRDADVAFIRKLAESMGAAGTRQASAIADALEGVPLIGEDLPSEPMPGPDDETGEGEAAE